MPRIPKFDRSGLRESSRVAAGDVTGLIDSARLKGRATQAVSKGIADVADTVDKFEKARETNSYFAAIEKYKQHREEIRQEVEAAWSPESEHSLELTMSERLEGLRSDMSDDINKSGRMSRGLETALDGMDGMFVAKAADKENKDIFKFVGTEGSKRAAKTAATFTDRTPRKEILDSISTHQAEMTAQGENLNYGDGQITKLNKQMSKSMMVTYFDELLATGSGNRRLLGIINEKSAESKKILEGFTEEEVQAYRKRSEAALDSAIKGSKTGLTAWIKEQKLLNGVTSSMTDDMLAAKTAISKSLYSKSDEAAIHRNNIRDMVVAQGKGKYVDLMKTKLSDIDKQSKRLELVNSMPDIGSRKMLQDEMKKVDDSRTINEKKIGADLYSANNPKLKESKLSIAKIIQEARKDIKMEPENKSVQQTLALAYKSSQELVEESIQGQLDSGAETYRVTETWEVDDMASQFRGVTDPSVVAEISQQQHLKWGPRYGQVAREAHKANPSSFTIEMVVAAHLPTVQAKEKHFEAVHGWADTPTRPGLGTVLFEGQGRVGGHTYEQILFMSEEEGLKRLRWTTHIKGIPERVNFSKGISSSAAKAAIKAIGNKATSRTGGKEDLRKALKTAYEDMFDESFEVGKGGMMKYTAPKVIGQDGQGMPINFNKEAHEKFLRHHTTPEKLADMGVVLDKDLLENSREKFNEDNRAATIRLLKNMEGNFFWNDSKDFDGVILFHQIEGLPEAIMIQRKDAHGRKVRKNGEDVLDYLEFDYTDTHGGIGAKE